MKYFLIKLLLPGFTIGTLAFGILLIFNLDNLPFAVSEVVSVNKEACSNANQLGLIVSGGPCTPIIKFKVIGFLLDLLIFILGGMFVVLIFRKLFVKEDKKDRVEKNGVTKI